MQVTGAACILPSQSLSPDGDRVRVASHLRPWSFSLLTEAIQLFLWQINHELGTAFKDFELWWGSSSCHI